MTVRRQINGIDRISTLAMLYDLASRVLQNQHDGQITSILPNRVKS